MILTDLFPFSFRLDASLIAGIALWALALYMGFSSVSDWIAKQLSRWFNFAERSLYLSQAEYERTRPARESQNAFYASIFSVIPFLIVGGLCNYGVAVGLGRSWMISMGIIACIGCGVYELGRRDGQSG
jgi:hypothetical protein